MFLIFRKYANLFTLKLGRPIYVTPASYLSLLDGFHSLMEEQQRQIRASIARYRNGLARLAEASEQVNRMQVELSELQPKLVEASKQTDAMMKTIQQESAEVEKTSIQIRADEVAANEEAAVATELKAECEADLAEALPALEGMKKYYFLCLNLNMKSCFLIESCSGRPRHSQAGGYHAGEIDEEPAAAN